MHVDERMKKQRIMIQRLNMITEHALKQSKAAWMMRLATTMRMPPKTTAHARMPMQVMIATATA